MSTWKEFYEQDTVLSPEEKEEIELKADIIAQVVNARKTSGLTQEKLQELTRVQQTCIARLERNKNDPQLTTLLKLLRPLGKTLAVVPLSREGEGEAALQP